LKKFTGNRVRRSEVIGCDVGAFFGEGEKKWQIK
jgi:hypothetical protein